MGDLAAAVTASSPPAHTWRFDLRRAGQRMAVALVSGMLCGALVGGVMGRLVMLVLRLTSSSSVYGTRTDDNFLIGRFSRSSLFLLALTAALGAVGGLFYLMSRRWAPARSRPWAMGAFSSLAGGAIVVEPGRVDFMVLEPLWFAVVAFLALPGLYGVATAVVIERVLARSERKEPDNWTAALTVILLVLCGPPGILLLAFLLGLFALHRRRPGLRRVWRSTVTTWAARALLMGVGLLCLADVVSSVGKIL